MDLTLTSSVVDLVEQGLDVVIRVGPLTDSGLRARRLADYRIVVCAAPSYLARYGAPRRPERLAGHACLSFRPFEPHDTWTFLARGGRRTTVRVRGPLASNNGQALRAAALGGAGIVAQSEALLQGDLAAGRLVRVLPRFEVPSLPMHALFPAARALAPKLRAFLAFLVEQFGPAEA